MDLLAVRSLVAAGSEGFVDDLRTMVDIDCGSYTPVGVNRIADLCEQRFRSGGWTVARTPHTPAQGEPQLGDLVVGRLEGAGGPRILLVGHMDTVFDEGTVAERPFRIDGDLAYGPGVSDMKGGLLAGF
ncbi:MAG: M20/M25/M40 family metallo-hydrolase, partial [Actinomycetota bacterium]